MKLTPEQAKAIGQLIRDYTKTLCELTAAKGMIRNLSQLCQAPPEKWQEALGHLTALASTKVPVAAFERVAVRFEQDADETDLSELLEKIPKDAPVN